MKMYRSEPLTDKEKRYLRTIRGTKQPFSVDAPAPALKKVRDYGDTIVVARTISPRKRRGFNGCKLNPAIRAMVERRKVERADGRKALFAALERGDV